MSTGLVVDDAPRTVPAPRGRPSPGVLRSAVLAGALTLAVCAGGPVDTARAAPVIPQVFSQRIAGATRVETAVAASQAAFPRGAPAVVLVQADATPDGLTASYAAGVAHAPILYVARDAVPQATADEITRLGARRAVVVGGESVVGRGVVVALQSAGIEVARLAGADRYATAAAVALGSSAAAGVDGAAGGTTPTAAPSAVLVADGESPADALAAGPLAYRAHEPILLVRSGEVPAPTADALARLAPPQRVVLGGTAVVDDAVAAAVGATARLAGADRQGTAVAVAEHAVREQGFTGAAALVGAGDRAAADALVAAPLAGAAGTPLLFTAGPTLGPAASAYLSAAAPMGRPGYVLGGTAAVPQAVVDAADAAAGG